MYHAPNELQDWKLCVLLDWDMRLKIVFGIARGLLYMHEDSRLRIIDRDFKTSNILLKFWLENYTKITS